MDNNSRSRPGDHLGVNRISKNIRKSPLHQPSFPSQRPPQPPPPPQPQVYNINKNDFRSLVQQLTGTPTRDPFPAPDPPPPAARPPTHNPPRPPSTRLQRIRPPPLAPLARPPAPYPDPRPPPYAIMPNPNVYPRPPPAPAGPPAPSPGVPFSPLLPLPPPPGNAFSANTLESPISAYMRYLESSILHSDGILQTPTQQPQRMPTQHRGQAQVAGPPAPSTDMARNPRAGAPYSSPGAFGHPLPSPAGLLPSPTSQFLLPSPSAFLNLLSPLPLSSPRLPMTPNFALSPMGGGQHLGPQPPLSPRLVFPPSPSGFFPLVSPRWRDL